MVVFSNRYLRFANTPRKKHIDVLWPVYVYRIIYPESNDKPLNLFQEGILGLFRAGCKQIDEISQLLDLDKELIKFIIATQLQPNGWLDERGKVTEEGKQLLDGESRQKGSLYKDDNASKPKQKIGYIFWDVIGKSWMPRFSKRLNEIEPINQQSNFPNFISERQQGKLITPYRLKAGFSEKPIIDNSDGILQAYRSYRLDIYHAHQLKTQETIPRGEEVRMGNIEFISDDPEPMYIWTSIFHSRESDELWAIQDPFGIRTVVPWLRTPLLSTIDQQGGLAKKFSWLIGEPQVEKQTAEDWLKTFDQKVRMEILIDYPYLENHIDIARYLKAVKRRKEQVEGGISQSENLESLLTDTQKLLESTLKWMLGKWTVNLTRIPRGNEDISKDKKRAVYQALDIPSLSNVSDQLSNQGWKQVHSVLRWKDEARASLKALLCGAVLSTADNQNHPFKQLSAEKLNFPKLLELADLRNQAGHASGNSFEKGEVMEFCDFSINWVKNFKEWF